MLRQTSVEAEQMQFSRKSLPWKLGRGHPGHWESHGCCNLRETEGIWCEQWRHGRCDRPGTSLSAGLRGGAGAQKAGPSKVLDHGCHRAPAGLVLWDVASRGQVLGDNFGTAGISSGESHRLTGSGLTSGLSLRWRLINAPI